MAGDAYPDPERRRNRGFLGSDGSALSLRDRHVRAIERGPVSSLHPRMVPYIMSNLGVYRIVINCAMSLTLIRGTSESGVSQPLDSSLIRKAPFM